MARILIVDDDPQLRSSFEKLLAGEGHEVRSAASGEAGLAVVRAGSPDLVIMDVRMPGMDGIETFEAMRQVDPKLVVIIVTAYGDMEGAIRATKLGAFDYVLKPFDIPEFLALTGRALEAARLMRQSVAVNPERAPGGAPADAPADAPSDALIGRSRAMHEVYKAIGRVAATDATVLVRGESGTGKELVARAIYQHSARADKPFLVINCVAIPETLLESELFGYEKGAFTGADARRVGKVEQANHGTLFLDEIGDMPLAIQGKLLRLLQEKKIERLGGRSQIPVDVRILAATNRDLEAAVADGGFREDLYYRLKVVMLTLPPLRARREDIAPLAEFFLVRFAREQGIKSPGLTGEAVRLLQEQPWPGNVRELANAVHKALIFNRGGPIDAADVAEAVSAQGGGTGLHAGAEPGAGRHAAGTGSSTGPDAGPDAGPDREAEAALRRWARAALAAGAEGAEGAFETLMDQAGRLVIQEALSLTAGNRTRAARLLGISRPTLLARIERYGLKVDVSVS
ncbi:MAG: sigma-54-dependent transcriptional regulator [Desulfovibrionaceae bacterium]